MPGIYDQLAAGMLEGVAPQVQAQGAGAGGLMPMNPGGGGGGPQPLMPGAGPQGLHPQMPLTMGGTVPPGFDPQAAMAPPGGMAPPPQQAAQPGLAEQFSQHLNDPLVAAALGFGTNMIGAGSVGEGLAKGIGGGLAGLQGAQQAAKGEAEEADRAATIKQLIARMGGVADSFGTQRQQQPMVGQMGAGGGLMPPQGMGMGGMY